MSPAEPRGAVGAVVPAAGRSSRMGAFKPLLPVGRVAAVERVVRVLRKAGVDDIVVIVGHQAETLLPVLKSLGVTPAHNPDFELGMFSSVQAGAFALPPGLDAFFVLPVDCPLVRPQVLRDLRGRSDEAGILLPTCCGRPGHPPLISTRYRPALLDSDRGISLREFLARHESDQIEVEVEDLTILMDMDTPADYRALSRFAAILDGEAAGPPTGPRSLTEEESLFLLAALGTPDNVVRHCRAVAAVGRTVAEALRPHLRDIDPAAVHTAGLLHDMVRTLPGHAAVAQRLLSGLGLPGLGVLVGQHMVMDPDRSEDPGITEIELVYLADKVVAEDEIVGLDGREARALGQMRSWPEATPAACDQIGERMRSARRIAVKVEAVLGYPLTELLARAGAPEGTGA